MGGGRLGLDETEGCGLTRGTWDCGAAGLLGCIQGRFGRLAEHARGRPPRRPARLNPPPTPAPPGGAISAKSARIRVSPGSGHRRTHFDVKFTAPEKTGTVSGATRRYQVGAATSQQQGCVASAIKSVGASRAGARVSTTLTPIGGSWCTGTYKGKIVETVTPKCGIGKVCPAYIGILRTIGTFKFRVS